MMTEDKATIISSDSLNIAPANLSGYEACVMAMLEDIYNDDDINEE